MSPNPILTESAPNLAYGGKFGNLRRLPAPGLSNSRVLRAPGELSELTELRLVRPGAIHSEVLDGPTIRTEKRKEVILMGEFPAAHLGSAPRRAAYALGMKTVRSFDILNHETLESALARDESTPMLRLYNRRQELTLTAGDLQEALFDLEPSAEPMARVLPK